MSHLTTRPAVTAGLAVAGLVGAFAATSVGAQAATASAAAAVQSCTLRAVSVQALDLQEDTFTDEIFLRLGDGRTTQQTYFEGQLRNTLGTGSDVFVGLETVKLVESDGPGNNTVLAQGTVTCAAATRTATLASANGDAVYRVTWQVSVNP